MSQAGTPGLAWRTLKNSIYGMLEFAWPLLIALFASPFIVHRLGDDAYGVLSVVGVTLGFFGFLDLGIGGAATRQIAVSYAKGDTDEINRVVATVLAFYLAIGAVGGITVAVLAHPLATRWLHIPAGLQDVTQFAFYVSAAAFAISVAAGTFNAIPRAIQRYDVSTKLAIVMGTVSTATTVGILAAGGGLGWVVLGGFVVGIVNSVAGFIIARRLVPTLKVRVAFEPDLFKELFSFGAYFLLSQLGVLLLYQADKLLLGSFLSVAAVTFYVIPGNLATKIQGLIAAATSVVFPVTSALFETGERDPLLRLYDDGTRLVLILGTSIAVPMAVFARPFLTYWMGARIASQSATVMVILVGTYYLLGLTSIPWGIANGVGRAKVNAIFTMLIAVADIALFFVLVEPFGVEGAAAAYLISAAVGVPILISYIERSVLRLSGARFLAIGWRIWVVGAVQAAASFAALRLVTNLLSTLILMLASVLLFVVVYVVFGFVRPADKALFAMLVGRLRGQAPDGVSEAS